jgi:uncharacterized protein (UPF0261 family)
MCDGFLRTVLLVTVGSVGTSSATVPQIGQTHDCLSAAPVLPRTTVVARWRDFRLQWHGSTVQHATVCNAVHIRVYRSCCMEGSLCDRPCYFLLPHT